MMTQLDEPGPLLPTTTQEQDRHTASQRRINMTWEFTQAAIAITVVAANITAAFYLPDGSPLLGNAFFLIVGFYFGRTNHTRLGGIQTGKYDR
jgi:hypothetical protein